MKEINLKEELNKIEEDALRYELLEILDEWFIEDMLENEILDLIDEWLTEETEKQDWMERIFRYKRISNE